MIIQAKRDIARQHLFMPFKIQPQHDISPNEIDAIEDRLYDHNRLATKLDDGRALAFVVRDEGGRLIAAAAGHSWGGSAELKQLWVEEADRRRGIGRKLLSAFETEAALRGVRQIWVMTFDFQAPKLYEKAGFERVAEFSGWPDGHSNIVFRKALTNSSSTRGLQSGGVGGMADLVRFVSAEPDRS